MKRLKLGEFKYLAHSHIGIYGSQANFLLITVYKGPWE